MTDPGYLETVYGRRRWFFQVQDRSAMKAQEREACNYYVQNLVADYINQAVINLANAHSWSERPFRLRLAVHDSIVLTCAGADVPYIYEQVLTPCLATRNIVPKLNFSFGIDCSISTRYSSKPHEGELEAIGVPAGYSPPDAEARRY